MKTAISQLLAAAILALILPATALCDDVAEAMKEIYMKNYDKAREIINRGIDVNKENRGSYLLNVACYRGHYETVDLLLEKGAKVNVVAGDGSTPLIQAGNGDTTGKIVRVLLDKGADVNAADKLGTSAFGKAVQKLCTTNEPGRYKVLEILLEHGADVENPVREGDAKGYTTLMMAVNWDKRQLVKFLLKNGADVNHAAADGMTPLMLACVNGYSELAKILVEAGAQIDAANEKSETARDLAEKKEHKKIVEYLDGLSE